MVFGINEVRFFRLFMQIMECCYYLNHTNVGKNNAKKEEDSNFVRLLTGSRALSNMADTDVVIPKDKSTKQVPFSMAVVKKSTGKRLKLTLLEQQENRLDFMVKTGEREHCILICTHSVK